MINCKIRTQTHSFAFNKPLANTLIEYSTKAAFIP